jgi:hypothetical protein
MAGNVADATETVKGAAGRRAIAHAVNLSLITKDTGAAVAARCRSSAAGDLQAHATLVAGSRPCAASVS